MSDPHIVTVVIDTAPWDSDIDQEVRFFEFNGPGEADIFRGRAESIARDHDDITVSVLEPEPATRFGNADDAVEALREWLDDE